MPQTKEAKTTDSGVSNARIPIKPIDFKINSNEVNSEVNPDIKSPTIEVTKNAISKINSSQSTGLEKKKAVTEITKEIKDPVKSKEVIDTVIENDIVASRNPLVFANKYLGFDENNTEHQATIKGFLNQAVPGYIKNDGAVTKDKNAWCAAFVNNILTEGKFDTLDYGKDNYNLIRAKQYSNIGSPVESVNEAKPGDVMVTRKWVVNEDHPKGYWQYHTGFYSGKKDGKYTMLGGNQNDKVSVRTISEDSIYSVRRVSGVEDLKEAEQTNILSTEFFDDSSKRSR